MKAWDIIEEQIGQRVTCEYDLLSGAPGALETVCMLFSNPKAVNRHAIMTQLLTKWVFKIDPP